MTDPTDSAPTTFEDLPGDALEALSFLRGHLAGLLRFDEEFIPIKIVVGPCGRIVAPVMVAMLQSVDCVLFLPEEPSEEDDAAIQLQVELQQFSEDAPEGALADRWRIYHGDPPDVNWATLEVDAARYGELFLMGEAIQVPNPLHGDEPAICREINADHEAALRAAVIGEAKIELDTPRLVGVDPLGFDVRGLYEVIRIPSPRLLLDGAAARGFLDELFEKYG
ncbi:MAG: DUF2470 domain-containing protein [Phycisphaerales bacterium]|nr:DUF2470 domain-containing protein [Phycisphaerales bacterium]